MRFIHIMGDYDPLPVNDYISKVPTNRYILQIILKSVDDINYMGRVLCNLFYLNGTRQFAKTLTPLKQQLYVQIIHAVNKHAPLG